MIRIETITPVANAVANARRKPGRYRNPDARRTYMAALMRRRRAERRAEREHDARLRAEIEQAAADDAVALAEAENSPLGYRREMTAASESRAVI